MVRPMLLYYIDFLTEDNQQYSNTYQIYETLVYKWIEREANKRKPYKEERENFKKNLYSYSEQVALKIYGKRKEITNFQLPKADAITIDVELKQYQMTGQSLLTRDVDNNWKFAHRSILEFFLAQKIAETIHSKNCDFALSFEFAGMDMAQQFCSEILDPHLFAIIGKYVRVEGGDFLMGSPDDEVDRFPNETQHEVRVSTFYLCKYAVTVADFHKFIADSGYLTDAERGGGSYFWDGKEWILRAGVNWRHSIVGNEREVGEYNHPVLHVSWNDTVAYCHWLSEKTGKSFRLPSEAEWEYACRAGELKPFSTGDNLTTAQANYHGDGPYNKNEKGFFRYNTVPVYYFKPNAWGLYNMHGNVFEWCSDWYGENYYVECKAKGRVENPQGIETGSLRVLRGGSWGSAAGDCRSAIRSSGHPGGRGSSVGFRLVFVP
ncbi:MAG: formylglycine-generating enzyme family protein [Chlorobium sp.]|nr:formylglycine-generating enzyme family protein [Chlorobium sp.]